MAAYQYTDEYKETAFYIYYKNNKCGAMKLIGLLSEENGNKPARMVVERWMLELAWLERADVLDAEMARALDSIIIEKRTKMFEEQEKIADELLTKGREFLNDKGGIKNDMAALRAIELGLLTKRQSRKSVV